MEILDKIGDILDGNKEVTVNVGVDNTAILKLVGSILAAGVILIMLYKAVK